MKTKILSLAILSFWSIASIFAQDRTTVTANNSDISDNLDLRAVASIFGDSKDLADFERRLNDPNSQISNLDLNGDNRVDYLRVIETVEGNVHLVIIQSVLGRDNYQDIATVEVERDRYNKVQVQVVGDVYMYGNNYIYEPVYAYTPVIYTSFWVGNYRPYYSSWYWGYYPSFYVAWTPFPIYTYHNHIGIYINHTHHYNYVNYRRCSVAYNNYYNGRRGNYYERQYPTRSFAQRNSGYTNRRELVNNRSTQNTRNSIANSNTRSNSSTIGSPRSTRNGSNNVKAVGATRNQVSVRDNESPRAINSNGNSETPRTYGNTRSAETPRVYGNTGNSRNSEAPSNYGNTRNAESPRGVASQGNARGTDNTRSESPRNVQRSESQRSASPREYSQQRGGNSQRSEGNSRGNRRG